MKFFILLILLVPAIFSHAQILTIEISGIRSEKGLLHLDVYTDAETFKAETPFRIYSFEKTGIIDGNLTLSINDLAPGIYGIAMIDDRNANGKIDRRLFMPSEGFGFSDYKRKVTCKPDFESFAFKFLEEKTTVKIEVQYF
jgi:uncharacterized protein (DUF2141 family)